MKWKDTSSYSQTDKVRIPNCWDIQVGAFCVTVHHHIHYPKDTWLVSCRGLDVSQVPLNSKDISQAQPEALKYILGKMEDMRAALDLAIRHTDGYVKETA